MRSNVPDADADPVVAVYVALCKSRGNTVKVYKPEFAGKLNGLFKQQGGAWTEDGRGVCVKRLGLHRGSPQGRVVSLLLHAFQSSVSLGEMLYRHSMLLFGPVIARHVENRVRNSEFVDFELRAL